MPTQKIFKQRVRARMTKTGESYTAARHQLLKKAGDPGPEPEVGPDAAPSAAALAAAAPADAATEAISRDSLGVPDDSMLARTGRRHAEWFALLDAWGATEHGHTEIARWLSERHDVPGWWTQSITVSYERVRGMRARHQMQDGFSVGATKTIATTPERALEAFSNARLRRRWLAESPMSQRQTRAAMSARFDWAEPPSRVVVTVVPKGPDKTLVSVTHEQLPDAETGERLKAAWRERLGALKAVLERG